MQILSYLTVYLIGRYACRRFKAPYFIYLDAVVFDPRIEVLEKIAGEIFGRRIKLLVKGRQFVDVAMVEVANDLVSYGLQITKIDQQAYVIQFLPTRKDLDLVIVTVKVLAFAFIAAKLVSGGEISLYHYLKKRTHRVCTISWNRLARFRKLFADGSVHVANIKISLREWYFDLRGCQDLIDRGHYIAS